MFWGFSPALDLLTNYKHHNSIEGKTELNILVAGSADARHVLMTISKYYTHEDAQNLIINFYIVDVLLELVARQMLLTLIALEPSDEIGLKEKADLWMEVFGNSMLRPTTGEYVTRKSYQFIKLVTNKNYQSRRIPCLNLDNLKYIEKDGLEIIFKFWVQNKYNMAVNWDDRLRKQLETRYDARMGVFDWDYYMYLNDLKDGDKVNVQEYKQWRNTGVAFTWLEKEFSVSNVTLALGIDAIGEKFVSLNYLGDIVSGPFYCFGLECEDSEMMKVINTMRAKRATDITERNLMRMFYEIEHKAKYKHIGEDRNLGTMITRMSKLNFEDSKFNVDCRTVEDDYTSLPVKHKLIFLPTNTLEDQAKLEKYHNFFDLMYISQNLIRKLNSNVLAMVKDNGIILMETRKFLILKKEDKKLYEDDVKSIMKESNCEEVGKCDFEVDNYVTFRVKINKEKESIGINEIQSAVDAVAFVEKKKEESKVEECQQREERNTPEIKEYEALINPNEKYKKGEVSSMDWQEGEESNAAEFKKEDEKKRNSNVEETNVMELQKGIESSSSEMKQEKVDQMYSAEGN